MSIADKVIQIVCDHMGVDRDQVNENTSFVNDLGADSLDQVELLMELEEKFDLSIPEEEAEKIQTVGSAVQFIQEHT